MYCSDPIYVVLDAFKLEWFQIFFYCLIFSDNYMPVKLQNCVCVKESERQRERQRERERERERETEREEGKEEEREGVR